jgi:Icc-related predicted phosphoesterase
MPVVNCMHISDTHQENIADIVITDLKEQSLGTMDLLFISGDLTYRGDVDKLKRCAEQCEDLITHGYVKDIVVIPGNHDKSFDIKFRKNSWFNPGIARAQFMGRKGVHLLVHQAIELHGIKIFGSPWTPEFHDWGFNYFPDKAQDLWKDIPQDCQILMTHGPPIFIMDEVNEYMKIKYCGCPVLAHEIVKRPSIKYHLFGHIHEGHGAYFKDGTTYLNSSIMDKNYKPNNKPQYFEMENNK